MTEVYLHIVALMAEYMATHPYGYVIIPSILTQTLFQVGLCGDFDGMRYGGRWLGHRPLQDLRGEWLT